MQAANLRTTLIIICTLFASPAWSEPDEFRAIYKADFKGIPINAKGIRELRRVDGNRYLLKSSAENFLASVTEQTLFRWQEDGSVIPAEYQYHRSGLGRNRDAILTFDWDENRVLNDVQSKPWRMDIPDGTMDKLLYQFKLRVDLRDAWRNGRDWPELSYQIADGGTLKEYRFSVLGEDRTETPVGTFNTIKAIRDRDDDDRESIFWLAPEYDFLLIRFRQIEDDGDGFELILEEAEFNGRKLTLTGS